MAEDTLLANNPAQGSKAFQLGFLWFLTVGLALGASVSRADMSTEEIAKRLAGYGINRPLQTKIMQQIQENFPMDNEGKLKISGLLHSPLEPNFALGKDTDDWTMALHYRFSDNQENKVLYPYVLAHFANGGAKFEAVLKIIFIIIPSDFTSIEELNGRTFELGFGASIFNFWGGEVGWLTSKDTDKKLFYYSVGVGFGLGINFPKVTFKTMPTSMNFRN